MPEPSFEQYFRRFLKRLYQDGAAWARDNIIWGVCVLVIPPLAVYSADRARPLDSHLIFVTLYLYVAVFILYALVHLVRTPWKLDSEMQVRIATSELERQSLETDLTNLKRKPLGPELWLHFKDFGLTVENMGGGTARNVRLLAMNSKTVKCSDSRTIPVLRIGEEYPLQIWVDATDVKPANQFVSLELLFMSTVDEGPVVAKLHCEDADGQIFLTCFEFSYSLLQHEQVIKQISRRQLAVPSNSSKRQDPIKHS